ncbi:MAG TPA: hypothetical protein VFW64_06950 [Pseudonocardiaceae bacterium]|nr:hypothetical protein [Pseudonocardiaceae bacterium]
MVAGHMAVSASGQGGLLLRVDPAHTDALIVDPRASRLVMRGREMDGWLRINIDAYATDDELRGVDQARCRLRQVAATEVIESENSQSGIRVTCEFPCGGRAGGPCSLLAVWAEGYRAPRRVTIEFSCRWLSVGVRGRGGVVAVEGFEGRSGGVEVGVCTDCGGDSVAVQLSADRFDDVGKYQAGAVGVLLLVNAD